MSTLAIQPKKVKMLNPKMLTIAAALLILVALLFLVTPLLRTSGGFSGRSGLGGPVIVQGNPGQGFPSGQGGSDQNFQNFPGNQGGQGFTNRPGGVIQGGPRGGLGFGLLGGMGATLIYGIALVLALIASVGMFNIKRWGQVLGIIMAVFYLLLSLLSFLPMLLMMRFVGASNPLILGMNILHLALAIGVIVFASLPGRQVPAPTPVEPPPTGASD
jgi:hypothetical protein